MSQLDPSILTAALQGLEIQKERLDSQIAEVRALLGGAARTSRATPSPEGETRPKRKVSASARKRMAAAQRKRWAAARGESVTETAAARKPGRPAKKAAKKALKATKKAATAEPETESADQE